MYLLFSPSCLVTHSSNTDLFRKDGSRKIFSGLKYNMVICIVCHLHCQHDCRCTKREPRCDVQQLDQTLSSYKHCSSRVEKYLYNDHSIFYKSFEFKLNFCDGLGDDDNLKCTEHFLKSFMFICSDVVRRREYVN